MHALAALEGEALGLDLLVVVGDVLEEVGVDVASLKVLVRQNVIEVFLDFDVDILSNGEILGNELENVGVGNRAGTHNDLDRAGVLGS